MRIVPQAFGNPRHGDIASLMRTCVKIIACVESNSAFGEEILLVVKFKLVFIVAVVRSLLFVLDYTTRGNAHMSVMPLAGDRGIMSESERGRTLKIVRENCNGIRWKQRRQQPGNFRTTWMRRQVCSLGRIYARGAWRTSNCRVRGRGCLLLKGRDYNGRRRSD